MDFYEDNHVIARPFQVMAVQLQSGRKPPFAEDGGDAEAATAAPALPMRVDLEGLAARTFPLPVPAGNHFFLRAGRGKVAW